jgi:hydrogenase maturation protease
VNGAARVIVLCCGNPARGDDALGALMAERVACWLEAHPGADVWLVVDYQLQVEHALDLEACELALFVDASLACEAPFSVERVAAGDDPSWTSHALSPPALLRVFEAVTKRAPPEAWLLAIRGFEFELGAELGERATHNLEAAWAWTEGWLTRALQR